jgi:SAM-dependent methyltransferase
MKCAFCKTEIDSITLDLGNHSPSNSLIAFNNIFSVEKTYPLVLYTCPNCYLVQIEDQVSSSEIFDEDYVYFSSASQHWLDHSKKYCEDMIKRLNLSGDSFVVEIASNDGYLLRNFVDNKIDCLGIEPTLGTAQEAVSKGVPTLVEFFNIGLAEKLSSQEKHADLIIANNVLAHVPDINDFVASFKKLLKPEGTITIEFPHLLQLVKFNEFDTIYHEHFFYFSIHTLQIIFDKHGLSIYDVDELETHGGSLRIYIAHKKSALNNSSTKINVQKVLKEEHQYNINTLDCYSCLEENAFKIKLQALEYLVKQKSSGKSIAAFGAAAKGNTFLNYIGIKSDIIDFIVDETPYKIGKYAPQSKIPIVSFKKIKSEKPDIIIILPWNHKHEILEKLQFTKEWGADLVTFIPELEIL